MNFKLKALVAAAVATITMSGAANALVNNEIFLVAYDATASKTFIAALGGATGAGSVSAFNGSSNLSFNYSTDANWTGFINGSTAGGVTYQVLGLFASNTSALTSYNAGDKLLVSSNALPGTLTNSLYNNLVADTVSSGSTGQFYTASPTGTGTSLVLGGALDSGANVKTNFFGKYAAVDTTAALGTDLGFYSVTRPAGAGNIVQSIKTQYLQGAVGSARDTWNLSSAGLLTYTGAAVAAVPEADTSAMMLAGLGLMGFVARRRTRA